MSFMKWTVDLETGISVIDHQHERIVDYINELHDAVQNNDRNEVGLVLDQLVEYTMSHFAFEEDLMDQAGYPFFHAHKKVHDLFARKVGDFKQRFDLGEDVGRQLLTVLRTWLINHIKRDDSDYAETVKLVLDTGPSKKKGFLSRLFG
jgi:hemerythrin